MIKSSFSIKIIFKYLKNSKYFILSSLWEDPGLFDEAHYLLNIISSGPNGPGEIVVDKNFLFKNNNLDDYMINFKDKNNTNNLCLN